MTIAGQTYTVNQDGAGCSYQLSATSVNVAASGARGIFGSVGVTAAVGCTWTAVSQVGWVTITSGTAGNGNGTVNFSVANNTGAPRSGTLTIAGQTFTVNQAGTCGYSLTATSTSVGVAGPTNGSVGVTTTSGCPWTAVSQVGWVTITSGASGTGSGTVNFTVAANTSPARSGTITIAGQTYTVHQEGTCGYQLSATSVNVAASGARGIFSSVGVTAAAGCPWTAVSQVGWVTITGGASGNGNGTVNFSVANNTGAPRSGTLTIAGQTFTVNQAGVGTSVSWGPGSWSGAWSDLWLEALLLGMRGLFG
jgi:hypothetical protein